MKYDYNISKVAAVARKLGLPRFDYAIQCVFCGCTERYSKNQYRCVNCHLKERRAQYEHDLGRWVIDRVFSEV